jgi:hypothetical protein
VAFDTVVGWVLTTAMGLARVGFVIGAGMFFDVSVGGALVLEALLPDRRGLVRAVLLLVVAVQLAAFTLWMLARSERRRAKSSEGRIFQEESTENVPAKAAR